MKPVVWLGASSPGGLALPDAAPTSCQFYAPRGVALYDDLLVVADTGNHRILLWHGVPQHDGIAADVVLGQPDFTSEGPKAGGRSISNGLFLPTAVGVYEGKLFVADAWHHRILVWNEVPHRSNTPPDYAIGQPSLEDVEANRGGTTNRDSLWCPYGMGWLDGSFYVCDANNRRVLGWHGLPGPDQPPDWLVGQPSWEAGEENRGADVSECSFRWPHAITRAGEWTYIADAGNHRVLGWHGLAEDRSADVVLGQPDLHSNFEFAYRPQGPARMRFPYALSAQPGLLLVGDTANNRLLGWDLDANGAVVSLEASHVLGQPNFDANGENRWIAVERDTLCWPYGVACCGDHIAVADSGNNRIMLWQQSARSTEQHITAAEVVAA